MAASAGSAGKRYEDAVAGRWAMETPIPSAAKDLIVLDAEADAEKLAVQVDFVFCAVNMKKDAIRALEEKYARLEVPVVSNNSANRWTEDVPMVVPEINAGHIRIIDAQRKRLGTKKGFIAVKSNCSIQSYVPALPPAEIRFGKGLGMHLSGHIRRRQDVCALAGNGGQLHPLYRRRRGKERAGAAEGMGPDRREQDPSHRRDLHHSPVASAWPARMGTWPPCL